MTAQPSGRQRAARRVGHAGPPAPRTDVAVRWVRDLARAWHDDRVGGLAAEIAFFALLSVFPALIAVAGTLGLLEGVLGEQLAADARDDVVGFFERILTEEASETVEAVRDLFTETTPEALTFGGLAALWAASRAFAAVVRALDVVYDVDESRSYVRIRGLALALALGSVVIGAVMLSMLVLGPLLGTGRELADRFGWSDIFVSAWDIGRWPVLALVLVAWATTLFHIAPNHRTPWRWDLPGAVVCALGWGLGSVGFRLYLTVAGGTNQVLGTLGGAVILVLWLYLLAVALLVGGEVNALLARRLTDATAGQPTAAAGGAATVSPFAGTSDGGDPPHVPAPGAPRRSPGDQPR